MDPVKPLTFSNLSPFLARVANASWSAIRSTMRGQTKGQNEGKGGSHKGIGVWECARYEQVSSLLAHNHLVCEEKKDYMGGVERGGE